MLISAQEEVTGLGAQTGAFAVQPEYAIAVDVTHGRTPDGPSDGVFDLGSGAAVGMGYQPAPRPDQGASSSTAKANDIDYTLEIMEGDTGTNAWTMQIVGRGIAMRACCPFRRNTCTRRSRSCRCPMCRRSRT